MSIGGDKARSQLTRFGDWRAFVAAPLAPPPPLLPPNDKVIMARFGAPRGTRGDIRLRIFSRAPAFFASLPQWWCRPPDGDWRRMAVADCRLIGGCWVARLADVDNIADVVAWQHGDAAVEQAELPDAAGGEFYWRDLIGVSVVNADGARLGEIVGLMDIGAHDVLRIRAAAGREILLPFVEKYVISDNLAGGVLRVDWQPDW